MKTFFRSAISLVCIGLVGMAVMSASATVVYYSLDNVMLDDGTQMSGIFSWSFTNDFEKGSGQFIALDIPWTSHDESDLFANIDVTKTIEITLTNNVHDDGVDIKFVMEQPLTPTTSSLLVLVEPIPGEGGESKYEIGGNGFHTGLFLSGSIAPINTTLSITTLSSTSASLSWMPDLPGYVLQEKTSLSTNWVDSASGTNNPVVVPVTAPAMFYRVVAP